MTFSIAFDEVELNREYSEAFTWGPTYQTSILGNPLGVHQRNVNLYDAIRSGTLSFEGMNTDDMDALETFFIARGGMARGFRFFPATDHEFNADSLGTGDGVETVFPLYRTYQSGGQTIQRRICKPNDVELTSIKYNGVPQAITYDAGGGAPAAGHYSIQTDDGTITFGTAPGAVAIVIDGGEFDVPVCFNMDKMSSERNLTFSNWSGIEIIELLPSNLGIT